VAAGTPASSPAPLCIANGRYRVSATLGDTGVQIACDGRPVCGDGLAAAVFADTAGSWGGHDGPADIDLGAAIERWTVTQAEVHESGPERALLRVRLAGARSRLDLEFILLRGRAAVDVRARLLWDERGARLRLLMPGVDAATYGVPGGTVERGAVGDVPALGWAMTRGPGGGFGLASDALTSFTVAQGVFSATVVRSSPYAFSDNTRYPLDPWWAVADCGELRFRFALCPPDTAMPAFAREVASPPLVQVIPATAAYGSALPRCASLAALSPASLALQALKPADDGDGLVLRVLETSGAAVAANLELFGTRIDLGPVAAGAIASWRLRRRPDGWDAVRCDLLER
jgi:alpha-mannosidase